jgi:hypothetical protein
LEVIGGLAKGLFDDDTLSKCIVHLDETIPSVSSSIDALGAALITVNAEKIKEAIANLRHVLKDVPQELQNCGANLQEVNELLDTFKEIVPSMVGELVAARASLHIGNWEGVGEHVGRAMRLLVPDEASPNSTQAVSPESDSDRVSDAALQVIIGLTYGLFNDQTFSQCVADVLQDTPDVEPALSDLMKALQRKRLDEIKKAILEVMRVMKGIPGSLKPCSDNVMDIQRLLMKLTEVGPKLACKMEKALRSLRSGDFEGFGENTGKAVRLVMHGDQPEVSDIVV